MRSFPLNNDVTKTCVIYDFWRNNLFTNNKTVYSNTDHDELDTSKIYILNYNTSFVQYEPNVIGCHKIPPKSSDSVPPKAV